MIETVRKLTLLLGEKQVEVEEKDARIATLEEENAALLAQYKANVGVTQPAKRALAGEGDDRE